MILNSVKVHLKLCFYLFIYLLIICLSELFSKADKAIDCISFKWDNDMIFFASAIVCRKCDENKSKASFLSCN